jgi:putative inorganic carbon (HCO3(-)) transporter
MQLKELNSRFLHSLKVSPLVLMVSLSFFSILFTIGAVKLGFTFTLFLLLVFVAVPLMFSVVYYPKFGIIVLLISSYFIMWVIRVGFDFPLGTLMDGLELLLLIGFLIHQKKYRNWEQFKDPISYVIIIWIAYNLLQFLNPTAESRLSWLYTIRSVAMVMLTYFVFVAQIKTVKFIKVIFKVWISLAVFVALYAYKQEYFGFFDFEFKSIDTPLQHQLLFIDGHWRKFSVFSDPVAFSYNMVISAILCLTLLGNEMKLYKKIILGICVFLFLSSMLFSGTRGAFPLLPLAVCLLAVLKLNKKILIYAVLGLSFLVALILLPSSNQNLLRFQSAFKPSNDASYNLRQTNQKRIQPYIQTHPFGGGLGATGTWGNRFAPNSYLAKFPPDSGYVRVAVELGSIGLLLFCTLIFIILKTGIKNYFKIQDPELKNYCLAMILVVFALNIGNYPQEALVQFPNSVYFYLVVAIINITSKLDNENKLALQKL